MENSPMDKSANPLESRPKKPMDQKLQEILAHYVPGRHEPKDPSSWLSEPEISELAELVTASAYEEKESPQAVIDEILVGKRVPEKKRPNVRRAVLKYLEEHGQLP